MSDTNDTNQASEQVEVTTETVNESSSTPDQLVDQGTDDQSTTEVTNAAPAAEPAPAPVPVSTQAPAPEPAPMVATPKVEKTTQSSDPLAVYRDAIETTRESGTPSQKAIISALDAFCAATAPRVPITPHNCYMAQSTLWSQVQAILKMDYEDFRKSWNTLLVYLAAYGGDNHKKEYTALSERYMLRNTHAWHDSDQCKAYVDIFMVARATRFMENRAKTFKSNFKIESLQSTVIDEKMISNLTTFYST